MNERINEADGLLRSNSLAEVIVGIEKLKAACTADTQPDVVSRLSDCFFQKNATVKRSVLAALKCWRPCFGPALRKHRHEMFRILYSNDHDSIRALSRLICMYSSEFESDDELFFELLRKKRYESALLVSRFSDVHKRFFMRYHFDAMKRSARLFYLATKCNSECIGRFVKHCKVTDNRKYLLKAVSAHPFIVREYGIDMKMFTKGRCGRCFLSPREARRLFNNFRFFEPEFCIQKMKIVSASDSLSYWDKWVLLKEYLARGRMHEVAKLVKELCRIEGLKTEMRHVLQFYYEKLARCANRVDDGQISTQLYVDIYGLRNNHVFKTLRRLYTKGKHAQRTL